MKRVIFAAAILLASCSKQVNNPVAESTTAYYRLQEVNKDGSSDFSPIRTATIDAATTGEDTHPNCPHHPLAIVLESFVVVKQKDNSMKIYWQATNEDLVDHYVIERSTDSKNWNERGIVVPNMTGTYTYTDK